MKKLLLTTATAVALLCGASTATAAQFMTWGAVAPDGSFSGTFGNNGVVGPMFTDTFNFTLPIGDSNFVVTSTFGTNQSNNIDFTSIRFNGIDFVVAATGQTELRTLNSTPVTFGSPQTLVVAGTNGGGGSYSGVVTFTPNAGGAVPEPSAWALMILGFGGAGAMLRRRVRVGAVSAA